VVWSQEWCWAFSVKYKTIGIICCILHNVAIRTDQQDCQLRHAIVSVHNYYQICKIPSAKIIQIAYVKFHHLFLIFFIFSLTYTFQQNITDTKHVERNKNMHVFHADVSHLPLKRILKSDSRGDSGLICFTLKRALNRLTLSLSYPESSFSRFALNSNANVIC